MLIQQCSKCKGDGFYRMEKSKVPAWANMANTKLIRREMTTSEHGSLYDYYQSIWGYEFECRSCEGRGEFSWQRGIDLTPIVKAPRRDEV